jgi:site-specific DNA recombinase
VLRSVPASPPRAVLYLRQSVSREDSISLELQETACRDYCTRRGYQVVAVHADPGISGRTFVRPGVTTTMSLVEDGTCDVIVLWKWSRLSRSRRDWALAADRVETVGGRIESATEAVDVSTSTGRFTRGMLTEMAAFESERIGEQWKETHQRRLRNGLPHTGTGRYGYRYSRTEGYQPDPEQAPVLVDLYRRYVAGEGFTSLTGWLNRQAIRTARGGEWRTSRVRYLLDSGFAAGLLPVGRDRTHIPGAHPALIDGKLWARYQARRQAQARLPARLRTPRWPLSGLVVCRACGGTLEAYSRPLKDGPVGMYRCTTYSDKGPTACPGVWVRRSVVEQAVKDWLAPYAADVDELSAAQVLTSAARHRAKTDAARLGRELVKLQAEADRMTAAVAQGLPMADYQRWLEQHETQRATVERALHAAQADEVEMVRPSVAAVRTLLAGWDSLSTVRLRELVGRMVARVEVARAPVFRGAPSVRVVARWDV